MAVQYVNMDGIGTVAITDEEMQQYTPDQFRQKLVKEYAEYAEENDVDIDSFSRQFAKEFTSTSRGIQELFTGERTTDARSDFLAEVALEKDPLAGYGGMIIGALADPVTLPFAFAKLFKLGRIGFGALAGAAGGGLGAVREEYGESRFANALFGAGIGGVLGAGVNVLMRKFNVKTPEELQKIADEGGAEAQKLAEEIEKLAEEPEVKQALAERGETPEEARPQVDVEIEEMKTEYARQQDIERQVSEMEAEVEAAPSSAQREEFFKAVDETNAYIEDVINPELERLQRQYNLATTSRKPKEEKRTILADLQKRIDDLKQEKSGREAARDQRDIPMVERLKELAAAKAEIRRYRNADRRGKAKNDGPLPSFVKLPEAPKAPEVKTSKVDIPEAPVVEAPVTPRVETSPEVVVPQQVAARTPLAQATASPRQESTLESLQQPAFTPKSVGSARPNILAQPTSAADAATLDLRTREARELGEPKQSNVNARPEMTPRQAKQQAFMEKQDENIFNADDVEGNFTFKNMLDAAEDKQRFVEAEIDEGNYKDAAAWLADEFENSSGIMSPANKIVASRIYAIASDNLIKLQDVFRRMEKSGKATAKDIEVLGEMQEDSQLRKAMDVMRNLERIEAQDKKNTSAALNAFKLANKMKKAQMQQLARARTISKLYFGVEC